MRHEVQIKFLREVPLFAQCTRRELTHVVKAGRAEYIDAGQDIMREGGPSTECYVLLAGTALAKRGGRKVATVGPGDIVGELGMLLDQRRTATVVAQTPVEVLVLDRGSLQQLIEQIPGFGWKLLQGVATRMEANRLAT